MTIPNSVVFTPSIPFVAGSYPAQIIPSSDYNLLIDNAYVTSAKARFITQSSASQSISNTSSGTWQTLGQLGSIFPTDRNRPLIMSFHAQIRASVVAANKLHFSLLYNSGAGVYLPLPGIGLIAKVMSYIATDRIISLFQYTPASSLTFATQLYFGWNVELVAPTITYTLPAGYKFLAMEV